MQYELKDFEKDVIEASNSIPIVIDFWAEWCGPCRQLGPTIEKLAQEADGRWKLVKINTDENPDIAIQFGVRGIPSVKMVYQQDLIAEFTGAQPEHMIRKWLEENLPDGGAEDAEEALENVRLFLGEGNRDQAGAVLEGRVTEDSSPELKVRYALLLLPDHIGEARQWMEQVEDRAKYDIEFEVLETTAHIKELAEGKSKPESKNTKAVQLYLEAAEKLMEKDFEEALPQFIESLQLDRELDDDGARKACIACFNMLGEQHPLSIKYRRQFSMSLY